MTRNVSSTNQSNPRSIRNECAGAFGLPTTIGEAECAGGLLKIREKSGGSPRCIRRGPATKRVLISGEKDNRESCRAGSVPHSASLKQNITTARRASRRRPRLYLLPSIALVFRFSRRFSYSSRQRLFTKFFAYRNYSRSETTIVIKAMPMERDFSSISPDL